jgi:phosphate starvation-inducible protein PhoH and related proteins
VIPDARLHGGVQRSLAETLSKEIQLEDATQLPQIFGINDAHLRLIGKGLHVRLQARERGLSIQGDAEAVRTAERFLQELCELMASGYTIDSHDLRLMLRLYEDAPQPDIRHIFSDRIPVPSRRRYVSPKTEGQKLYVDAIRHHDIVFAIGPAGTGKTYLAMAMAVSNLFNKAIERIILARPAVEAGEKLGFLPGDLQEKVNPYLRPLYDALYDTMEFERAQKMMERGTIEIAPLAYMRGRTLNDSFIILDEAQNTTSEQMKMFLTRLGYNSKAVITGDVTQVDLAPGKVSGLVEVQDVLRGIEGIRFVYFTERDVVRHELVQQIIRAYETYQPRTERRGEGHGGGTPSDGTGT